MKEKNGFTLIELLAVVVILAVIALIATPIIINVIENARKKAFENSVYGVMETYKLDAINDVENIGKRYNFPEANAELKYTGTKMIRGSIFLDSEKDIEVRKITDGIYCADGNKKNLIIKKGDCSIDLATAAILKPASSTSGFLGISGMKNENIESIKIVMVNSFPEGSVDVSERKNGSVMLWTKDENGNGKLEVYIGAINDIVYANPNSSRVFANLINMEIMDLNNLDTSMVTDMSRLFYDLGRVSTSLTLNLGTNFDTTNVLNMKEMFYWVGLKSLNFTLDLGNKFDTSNVTDMSWMFYRTGNESTVFTLNLGNKFDTSNVTNMQSMFNITGLNSIEFTLNLGDKFDTSKVTNMSNMFNQTGALNTNFTLNLGNKFDTSKVTNMENTFKLVGSENQNFTLDLGAKFNIYSVTNSQNTFEHTGSANPSFKPKAEVKTQAEKNAILAKYPNIDVTVKP
jgi:bacterial surface protein 26-residue repeat/prepilin-type N-terminal cleavage/methylation domain